MTGAKSVELEGVAKNISARTMSLCQAGQVLLTKEAMTAIKGRTNVFTPKGTRYACVGEYRFKGVKETQIIYAVGSTIESLQPPPGSDKVKRLGGPKKIKRTQWQVGRCCLHPFLPRLPPSIGDYLEPVP